MTAIRRPMHPAAMRARALALGLAALAALAACRPEPPPTEQPPEPQAQAHNDLRDAIRAPQDKARATEQTLQDAADRQKAAVDAAEGG
jgi:hypothetical protein